MVTTEKDMCDLIEEALEYENSDEGIESEVKRIRSFDEAGLLTTDSGLVIKMKDGSEFQITVVKACGSD